MYLTLFKLLLQEFYIRHKDGTVISSEPECQRVIQCLQAAVERRTSEVKHLSLMLIKLLYMLLISWLKLMGNCLITGC